MRTFAPLPLPWPVLLPLSLGLLWAFGCSSPKDNALFADDGLTSAASASAGGSSAAASGTDSGSGASPAAGGSNGEAGSQAGTLSGGAGGSGGSVGGAVTSGGSSGGGQAKAIESCDMLEGAVTNEQNGHCYRVNADKLSFAAARDACQAVAGGHLVTLGDEAEDDFAHGLLDAAHWIGASDGRPDRTEGTGPYTWVDGEPWSYANWESGQPNAVGTNCPDETSGSNCYEHCAFQTAGGAWNDRACFHTIASICEWDLQTGATSAGGAGPAR